MATSDTTKNTAHGYIYQVISSKYNIIYYSVNQERDTTPCFSMRRIVKDLYKPRVKIRNKNKDILAQKAMHVINVRSSHACKTDQPCDFHPS
jgi:hypothetical protein